MWTGPYVLLEDITLNCEVTDFELPHQDLHCLQIQLFSPLAFKVFKCQKLNLVEFANSLDPDELDLYLLFALILLIFLCIIA